MEKVKLKLLELKDVLEKAITMPSIKGPKLPKLPAIGTPETPKQPGLTPSSQKNPVKVAQQIEDPSTKSQALDMAKEKLKLSKSGQWSLV